PVAALLEELAAAACRDLALERDAVTVERLVDVRYVGQAHELTVELPDGPIDAQAISGLSDRFHERYVAAYGSTIGGPVELVSFRARVTSPVAGPIDSGEIVSPAPADAASVRAAYFAELDRWVDTPIGRRHRRRPGCGGARGPAGHDGDLVHDRRRRVRRGDAGVGGRALGDSRRDERHGRGHLCHRLPHGVGGAGGRRPDRKRRTAGRP